MDLGYALLDADNHYYEPPDCFSRHIEAAWRDRAVVAERRDGRWVLVHDGRVIRYSAADMFDEAEPPGSLLSVLRNRGLGSRDAARVAVPHDRAYVDRSARLAVMDRQGVEGAILLPSVGVTVEQALSHDPPALMANVRAFNRWLEEEWGYGADGRIYGVPVLTLHDLPGAVAELDRVLASGARFVYLRPGHVGGRSPADAAFDPFWARIDEAGVPVVLHVSAGLLDQSADWGEDPTPHHKAMSAFQFGFFFGDRPIMDMLGALILHNLFGRFPNVRILSIENGSAWVPYFQKVLHKGWRMAPFGPAPWGRLEDPPIDVFHEHVWIAPYPESDNAQLVEWIGADRVLFGSDYPHPEGCVEPVDFVQSLGGVPEPDVRKVMRGNLEWLLAAGR
ncbi:MAG: amidohydrolase family protein [Acidimicrobiia bacterium]